MTTRKNLNETAVDALRRFATILTEAPIPDIAMPDQAVTPGTGPGINPKSPFMTPDTIKAKAAAGELSPGDQMKANVKAARTAQRKSAPKATPKSLQLDDYGSIEEYLQVLEATPVETITAYMNKHESSSSGIFPSQWEYTLDDLGWDSVPYPGKLAEALVMSNANESISDLGNLYYSRRDYSDEAIEIFRQDSLKTGKDNMMEFGLNNAWELVDEEPELMAKIILTMTPQELEKWKEAEENYGPGADDVEAAIKKLSKYRRKK